jgi:hypothetical protein
MIDERQLSTLLDLTDPAEAPPLGQVVHRGRRLRRHRQLSKAASVVAVAALVVGVARVIPAPTREIRTASVPGGDAPAPEFGEGANTPAPGGDRAGSGSHEPAGGTDPKATSPTTATTATTVPPKSDHKPDGDGQPVTTPTTKPIPHSTVATTNGKLTSLVAAGLSPAFDAETKYYTAPADHDVITVTATLADPDANLYIQSTKVDSGVPFRAWVGDGQSVDIVIYSDWTEIGRYIITRPGDTPPPPPTPHSTVATTNGKLAGLTAAGLSPAFDPATLTYTAPADHDVITVTATLDDPNANLYIQSTKVTSGQPFRAWVGGGKTVDIVIYSDWTEIGRYTISRAA